MSLKESGSLFNNMTNSVIPTPTSDVQSFIYEYWGFSLPCRSLSCERDEIFLIGEQNTKKYILRLSNPADDSEIISMQINAVNWIKKNAPKLPIPGYVSTTLGMKVIPASLGDNPVRLATLSAFLEGELLANVPSTALQMKNVGQILAEMDVALEGFDHKGAHRVLAWDVAQAASCRSMLPEKGTTDNEIRWGLVRNRLDCFVTEVLPRLRDLRKQVLHADFNPYNILMDVDDIQKVSGILDLGDMVYTQLINNVAVAATYQINDQEPLSAVVELVTSYHGVLPLKSEEIDLLYDLIITRLCMAVTITEFRARQYPENSHYILKNTATAWQGLERLSTVSREEASVVFRMACKFPPRR